MARRLAITLALIATATAAQAAQAAQAAVTPRMHFDNQLTVRTACFSVVNPAGSHSVLYGQRFTDGTSSTASPTIVLVHGLASSTENWDFSRTWSAARALASAGYVVVSYDLLGFAKSRYTAGSGGTLTTAVQRQILHQVVEQVKAGSYTLTTRSNCSKPGDSQALRSDKVVIVGHSAGGLVVAGYPGQYHDVAAMIQADISASKPTTPAPGGGFNPQPGHVDYFQFFQTRQDCETFNAFGPGVVKYVLNIACTPPFIPSPFGEITDLGAMLAENDAAISQIGPGTPVLLAAGDHDTTAPPEKVDADFKYYKAHCNCDVSRYTIQKSGHLWQVHASLQQTVDEFVSWLSAHGLPPAPHGAGHK